MVVSNPVKAGLAGTVQGIVSNWCKLIQENEDGLTWINTDWMAWFDAKSLEKSVGGRLHQVWNLEIDERQYKISNGEYKCNMRGDQATEN
jgi:hypothetical protein